MVFEFAVALGLRLFASSQTNSHFSGLINPTCYICQNNLKFWNFISRLKGYSLTISRNKVVIKLVEIVAVKQSCTGWVEKKQI